MRPSRRILTPIVFFKLEHALLVGLGPDPCVLLVIHNGLQKVSNWHKEEDTLEDKKADKNPVAIIKAYIIVELIAAHRISKGLSVECESAGGPDCDKPRD
jgi:hypothetical protein